LPPIIIMPPPPIPPPAAAALPGLLILREEGGGCEECGEKGAERKSCKTGPENSHNSYPSKTAQTPF